MKRILTSALLALATLFLPLTAHAGHWVTDPHTWRISYQGGCATCTNIIVRDTLANLIAAGRVDTVSDFSLNRARPIPRGAVAPGTLGSINTTNGSGSDTTVVGYIVFQCDSASAPTTPTLSSMTVLIDGRMGGFGSNTTLARGWVKADSALINGAAGGTLIAGDETIAVPIRTISPYGNVMRWQDLRARITAATGVMSGAVRVFIRYWTDD